MSSGVFITESECCDRTCCIAILVPKTNETEACLVGEEISQINKKLNPYELLYKTSNSYGSYCHGIYKIKALQDLNVLNTAPELGRVELSRVGIYIRT